MPKSDKLSHVINMDYILDINSKNQITRTDLKKISVFNHIYTFFIQDMYAYGLSISSRKEHVQDAIQDVFYQIYEKPRDFKDAKHLKFFLLHSLKNRIYDIYRKESRLSELDNFTFNISIDPSVLKNILEKEEQEVLEQRVKKMLSSLTQDQQEIIYLHYMQGLDYNNIATLLNIEPATVRKMASRAIQKIRKNELIFIFSAYLLSVH